MTLPGSRGKKGWNWLFGYQAVVYAAGLLLATGLIPGWGQWHSNRHTHRQQVSALLEGRLALSRDLGDIEFSNAWSGGGVQQVWGLGVALWQLPFEVAARVFGEGGFPDRIAFGLFAALVGFVALRAWVLAWADEAEESPGVWEMAVGFLGGVGVLLLSAPFVTLLQARRLPLEETAAYAYLFALLLMGLTLGFVRRPGKGRWLLLCGVAGLGGLMRPTLVFYGLASLAVSGWIWLRARHGGGRFSWKAAAMGLALFCAGNGLLWWTNLVRFGDGFEFGHRLNVQSVTGTLYATRFDHPFEAEPLWAAGRELFGALFCAGELNGAAWYRQDFFPGQSGAVRWREFYFRTYDWTYVPLVLLGWGVAAVYGVYGLKRRRKEVSRSGIGSGVDAVEGGIAGADGRGSAVWEQVAGLGGWSLMAALPLFVFYLYVPVISSRYMMDFAPAFAVAAALGWTVVALRCKRWWSCGFICLLLCVWVGAELALSRVVLHGGGAAVTWSEVNALKGQRKKTIEQMPGAGLALGEERSGIPFDGTGWDKESGQLKPLVVLFVYSPEFLELELENGSHPKIVARPEEVRAKVGLETLERARVMATEKGWVVRFNGPRKEVYREGIQTVFVATVPREYLAEEKTPWVLRRARWRDGDGVRGRGPSAGESVRAELEGNNEEQ
jgi:hypothetical protein